MKNRYYIFLLLIGLGFQLNAQDLSFKRALKTGPGENGSRTNFPYELEVDPSGNAVIAGLIGTRSVDFNPDPIDTFFLRNSSGWGVQAYLQKLDSTGEFIWAKKFGLSYGCIPMGVKIDQHSNIYIAGTFEDSIDLDPGPQIDFHFVGHMVGYALRTQATPTAVTGTRHTIARHVGHH